jgi:hypothetical protein
MAPLYVASREYAAERKRKLAEDFTDAEAADAAAVVYRAALLREGHPPAVARAAFERAVRAAAARGLNLKDAKKFALPVYADTLEKAKALLLQNLD